MRSKVGALFVLCCLIANTIVAKEWSLSFNNNDSSNVNFEEGTPEWNLPLFTPSSSITWPTLGLGIGVFSFRGDVYENKRRLQSPAISRIAYELYLSQAINDNLSVNFNVLFGTMGSSVRFGDGGVSNANFESEIRALSVVGMYEFGHLFKGGHIINPYVTIGLESFEFSSKSDLFDGSGNRYYYWEDGSIRSLSEFDANAANAVILQRDFTYETDLREENVDLYGKYSEKSFAIPVGIGAEFPLNDFLKWKLSTVFHITFTDYIDGVVRSSNKPDITDNDFFLFTSCGLSYNFGLLGGAGSQSEDDSYGEGVDFLALMTDDMDEDGVMDIWDECQGTPYGVDVDTLGCPFDDDNDGIPNYRDREKFSREGAIVDVYGVELTDSVLAYEYDRYVNYIPDMQDWEKQDEQTDTDKLYTVHIGTFNKGVPAEMLTKFLSIHDISGTNISDSTSMYTAGSFNNIQEANKRRNELVASGIKNAKVKIVKGSVLVEPSKSELDSANDTSPSTNQSSSSKDANDAVAATSPNANPSVTSDDVKDAVAIDDNAKGKDTASDTDLYDGSSSNRDAALSESAGVSTDNNQNKPRPVVTTKSLMHDGDVVFRVQLGAYSNPLSASMFEGIDHVVEIRTSDGLYKYATRSYATMDEAAKEKIQVLLKGYDDAFITAYKNGQRIPIESVGAHLVSNNSIVEISDTAHINVVNKHLVKFSVQVGLYQNEPPKEKVESFKKMGNVNSALSKSGLMKYTAGSFDTYVEAEAFRFEIIKKYGLSDSFVVATFNGEYISVQEALELVK